MKNAFIAFFDILGFKNLVEKNKHEDLLQIYHKTIFDNIDLIERHLKASFSENKLFEEECLNVKMFIISDSIILIQQEITTSGLYYLTSMVQSLLSVSIADGVPLRGAISYGPISIIQNLRGVSIVGLGLTKAFELEKIQEWSGGVIDRECFNVFKNISGEKLIELMLNNKNPMISEYKIPYKKSDHDKWGYCIAWPPTIFVENEEELVRAFTMHKKKLNSDKEQQIVDNTLKFYLHQKKLSSF